jgi:hypothetical protein
MAFPSLQSGVTYSTQQPNVQRGAESIFGAMGQIVGSKIQDEQRKQAMYEELLNIGLEDVKGKYQEEAAKMKSDMLKRTSQIFAEAEGMPTMAQMQEIKGIKGKLGNYVKMYTGMEDWYLQASMVAAKIPDKKYQQKTIANIQDIMSSASLSETWEKILSKPWLELPTKKLDIFADRTKILNDANWDNSPYQAQGVDKYGNVIYEAWKGRNPEQIRTGASVYWNSNEEELRAMGFKDEKQFTEEFIGNEKTPQNTVRSLGKGSGSSKKPVEIEFNVQTGQWEFGDINKGKGIVLADFTPPGGTQSIKDATIVIVKPDATNGMIAKVVAPSIQNFSLDDLKKYGDEKWVKSFIQLNPAIVKGKASKDPLNLDSFWVPYYMVQSFVPRHVKLKPAGDDAGNDPDNLFPKQ